MERPQRRRLDHAEEHRETQVGEGHDDAKLAHLAFRTQRPGGEIILHAPQLGGLK